MAVVRKQTDTPEKKAAANKPKRGHIDYILLATTLFIIAFGMMMLFSASFYYAQNKFGDGYYYITKQVQGILIGGVLMTLLANLDYHILKKFYKLIFIGSLIFLGLVWIPGLGQEINEARRWINVGFSIQTSEVAKYGLIVAVAAQIEQFGPTRIQSFRSGIIPLLCMMAPFGLMLLLQPNYSMLMSIAIACFMMLFMAKARLSQMGVMLGVGASLAAVGMFAKGYRANPRLRLSRSLERSQRLPAAPVADRPGQRGNLGNGPGSQPQKFLFLPYMESDMIFAIIAEEFGLVGAVALIGVYCFLFSRGFRIAMRCPDTFGSLLAGGITTLLALQTFINIAVATGSMPTTGVTLPFISAGLSSIIVCMCAIGMLLSISRSCN